MVTHENHLGSSFHYCDSGYLLAFVSALGITNNIFGVYILNLRNLNQAKSHAYIFLVEAGSLIS